jgi:hypothetical protein
VPILKNYPFPCVDVPSGPGLGVVADAGNVTCLRIQPKSVAMSKSRGLCALHAAVVGGVRLRLSVHACVFVTDIRVCAEGFLISLSMIVLCAIILNLIPISP